MRTPYRTVKGNHPGGGVPQEEYDRVVEELENKKALLSWAVITTGIWWWYNYWWAVKSYMSVIQKNWNLFWVASWTHLTSSSNDWVCYAAFGKKPNENFYWASTALVTSISSSRYKHERYQNSEDLSKIKLKLFYRSTWSWTSRKDYYNYMDIDIDAWTITKWEEGVQTYDWDSNPLSAPRVSVDPQNIQGYVNWWATNVTTKRGYSDDYYLTFTLTQNN